ncbi:MAG: glycine cleavage system protein H [Pirellulales bacterium]|nr:glycine cleavage system protein H [Pirellulales bacterium]
MPKPLIFMMGRSPAFIATDRQYARNHMWVQPDGAVCRVGFSAYAVKLLGDVHHLAWSAAPGRAVRSGDPMGFIEGSKATSDLYCPMDGEVAEFNPRVLADPSLINSNLYDDAWLFSLADARGPLLSSEQYLDHLEASWPLAQRLLKGQSSGRDAGAGGKPASDPA